MIETTFRFKVPYYEETRGYYVVVTTAETEAEARENIKNWDCIEEAKVKVKSINNDVETDYAELI